MHSIVIQPIPQILASETVLAPAFFFLPVAVAVLSPPPMVTVPITIMPVPLGARESTSPPTVMRPPAVRVWPAITTLVIGAWFIREAVLVFRVVGAAFDVCPLTMTAPPVEARETVLPSTVATPPGVTVDDPTMRFELESNVGAEEPTCSWAFVGLAAAEGFGRVITWPLVVIAPPGVRVWPPITKAELEFAVMLELPTTTTAGIGTVGVAWTPLMITALPSLPSDISCPSTVIAEPGLRVCDPTMISEFEPLTRVWDPNSRGAGGAVVAAPGAELGLCKEGGCTDNTSVVEGATVLAGGET
jgi:hypothetical protein